MNNKLGLSQDTTTGIFTKPTKVTTLNKERKSLKEKEMKPIKKKKRKNTSIEQSGMSDFVGVSCGKYHTLFLISGNVFSVGAKEKGVLGYNIPGATEGIPISINYFNTIKIEGICAGQSHCLAWSSSGKLFSWGKVSEGCLGYINEEKSDMQIEPRNIEALSEYDI